MPHSKEEYKPKQAAKTATSTTKPAQKYQMAMKGGYSKPKKSNPGKY